MTLTLVVAFRKGLLFYEWFRNHAFFCSNSDEIDTGGKISNVNPGL